MSSVTTPPSDSPPKRVPSLCTQRRAYLLALINPKTFVNYALMIASERHPTIDLSALKIEDQLNVRWVVLKYCEAATYDEAEQDLKTQMVSFLTEF